MHYHKYNNLTFHVYHYVFVSSLFWFLRKFFFGNGFGSKFFSIVSVLLIVCCSRLSIHRGLSNRHVIEAFHTGVP